MDTSLQKKYTILIREYNVLLKVSENLTNDQLNTPLKKGKWSIAQILYHLNISMKNITGYVSKKIQYPDTIQQNRVGSSFRSFYLNAILKTDFKFKAPKGLGDMPAMVSLENIKASWQDTSTALQNLLETLPSKLIKKNVFRHPIAGRLTMYHTLSFMIEHLRHHKRQIKNL